MKKLLFVLLFTFSCFAASAQYVASESKPESETKADSSDADSGTWKSKIFYSGGFGLQFGNPSQINLSPIIGYRITPKLGTGLGPVYSYFRIDDTRVTNYGARWFSRYLITDEFFLSSEVDYLSFEPIDINFNTQKRIWQLIPLVGGGYFSRIGKRGGVSISLLYNLNYTENGPYQQFVPRVGFFF